VRKTFLALTALFMPFGVASSAGCHNIYILGEGPGGDVGAEGGAGEGGPSADAAAEAGPWTPTGPDKPGCVGLTATCSGKDCCTSSAVPGGSFNRSNDSDYPATISDFKLDVYEVVVGRFRAWVNAGKGTQASAPAAGEGADPNVPDSGWDPSWTALLPKDNAELRAGLGCNADYPMWSDYPGANENKALNCVTWFQAFAFCAWDGGWLPTETEWNYAAAGGSEQREYPWGSGIDATKASYSPGPCGPCVDANNKPLGDILVPGSRSPAGDGRWGHADMAGNVWEWTMDWVIDPYRLSTCTDCADLEPGPGLRSFRGGAFNWDESFQKTSFRGQDPPEHVAGSVGFRCARRP
jgi:formylglycine-generating enzyme required for sulfatase activity